MTAYKRKFGREQNAPAKPAQLCQYCGKAGLCSMPVFLRVKSDGPAHVVCYKTICVYCGKIQQISRVAPDGTEKKEYAFFTLHSATRRVLTALRDFFLPREMYETPDGKADIALKVRLVRALLSLQLQRPTERSFYKDEVYERAKENL